MNEQEKQVALNQAREHVTRIRAKISEDISKRENKGNTMQKDAIHMLPGDAIAQYRLAAYNQERIEDLKQLYPSPYFTRCEFEVNGENKVMYFGKFSFSDEKIYSWIVPAATLRYENCGPTSYTRQDGQVQSGILHKKDQCMIVDGHLKFLSTESIEHPRELIFQEHFTRQKKGFILPEVVEQMEKSQDQIVRAPFRGPFLISGPAGSGKTTMAFHRIAYLMQSPETTSTFTPDAILVLVQDAGTKEYFSHLLPELGIRGVEILTFAEWAFNILNLGEGFHVVSRFGRDEQERNLYEFSKLSALRSLPKETKAEKNIWKLLEKIYVEYFSPEQQKLFTEQKKQLALDRFDITILLTCHLNSNGEFAVEKEYYEESINGSYRKKTRLFPLQYNLMIIDEFQNYLPEQLQLLKSCLNHRLESVVYVGDLAQQTQLGTVRNWTDIGEKIEESRLVTLQKVYRNTKQILSYIRDLGYSVQIPAEIKDGLKVEEYVFQNKSQEMAQIRKIAEAGGVVGVLAKSKEYLDDFKKEFAGNQNIHCLSMQEAQGVEFDKVCIVGVSREAFELTGLPEEILTETKKVQRDLLYVALTRAMSELHVMGKEKLSSII